MICCRSNSLLAIALLTAAVVVLQLRGRNYVQAAETPQTIVVDLERSRLVSLPKQSHRVIVADPALLQVTVSADEVILKGLDRGETTMVVLDQRGAVVMKSTVRVEYPFDPDVFVQHGLERRTYHCAPLCKLLDVTSDGGSANAKTSNGAASRPTDSKSVKAAEKDFSCGYRCPRRNDH